MIIVMLCMVYFAVTNAQELKIIDSLHVAIGEKRTAILKLASEGLISTSFAGPMYDPNYKGSYSTVDLSVYIGEVEFTVILSGTGKRGQVTVSANGDDDLPFVCYIMYSRFDGIGSPMELSMGDLRLTKDPRQYDRESDGCNRSELRMNTMQEIGDIEYYINQLQNTVIPVLDAIIEGKKR